MNSKDCSFTDMQDDLRAHGKRLFKCWRKKKRNRFHTSVSFPSTVAPHNKQVLGSNLPLDPRVLLGEV